MTLLLSILLAQASPNPFAGTTYSGVWWAARIAGILALIVAIALMIKRQKMLRR